MRYYTILESTTGRIQRGHSRDKVLYAETLRNLSQALPEGTRVGYISDIKQSDRRAWLVRYFSTQYAVAPRVLEDGTAPNWLIVNAVAYDRHLIPDGMVLVRDFGDGMMLFRREKNERFLRSGLNPRGSRPRHILFGGVPVGMGRWGAHSTLGASPVD